MKVSVEEHLNRLNNSSFRRKFYLGKKEREVLMKRGFPTVQKDCRHFLETRLSEPASHGFRDGRQTPWKGHPVFVAQHATATCCRGCLERWYNIEKGSPLSQEEIEFVESLIMRWIQKEYMRYE